MPNVVSVNVARPVANPDARSAWPVTGIDKVPTSTPVQVRAPGELGSGLVGDLIGDQKHHGGPDQAVYAYAREDLDEWQRRLGRELPDGVFGENLTTLGVEVTEARIGERWTVGSDGLVLEVSSPRTPCRTFTEWLQIPGWAKTFTEAAIPGAYFRVISPGAVRAGDQIVVTFRPDHDVTVGMVFRAKTSQPELLPRLAETPALAEKIRDLARRRVAG